MSSVKSLSWDKLVYVYKIFNPLNDNLITNISGVCWSRPRKTEKGHIDVFLTVYCYWCHCLLCHAYSGMYMYHYMTITVLLNTI